MKRSSPFAEGPGPALTYFGYRAAAWLGERLPLRVGDGLARVAGEIWFLMWRRRRAVVRRNLRRVVGEGPHLDTLVHRAFHSYARHWLETFRLPRYTKEDLLEMVEGKTALLESALAAGSGVIIVSAHFGYYEIGAAWIGAKGYPITTVAELLRPRALFDWFAAKREAGGVHVIPSSPGAEARRLLAKALGRGEGVALVAERDLRRRGVWVEFFGERTTFPVSPALLAARTGVPLLSGALYGTDRGFRIDFQAVPYSRTGDEQRDVEAIAGKIAAAVEKIVRAAPEQWHLFSTNWPSDEPHLPPRGVAMTTGATGA
jgi:lauroyl/myristoyl acyltransferase